MKPVIFFSAIALMSFTASADVIRCVFTEPFVSTEYSMAQQTLSVSVAGENPKVLKNVSFQIKGAGEFDIVDKKGQVLQTLKLTGKGSDGMSDTVFPYDVYDKSQEGMANNGVGGCTSNYMKSKPGIN